MHSLGQIMAMGIDHVHACRLDVFAGVFEFARALEAFN
jgi:hypothetical protein